MREGGDAEEDGEGDGAAVGRAVGPLGVGVVDVWEGRLEDRKSVV